MLLGFVLLLSKIHLHKTSVIYNYSEHCFGGNVYILYKKQQDIILRTHKSVLAIHIQIY